MWSFCPTFSLVSRRMRFPFTSQSTCTSNSRCQTLMSDGPDTSSAIPHSFKMVKSLYPPTNPYFTDYLQVSNAHSIYYEISGNSDGLPVVFVHGEPGGGTVDAHRRFFDPEVYKIVLFDQRGCGKSTPTAFLEDNNTWALVEDMEKVREACQVERWVVFGGSWGSTLSIAYAQCHPRRVIAMILRGIFMVRKQEVEWLYERNGAAMLYPEAFERYLNGLPEELREESNLMKAYYKVLESELDSEERRRAANAWSDWERTLSCFPKGAETDEEGTGSDSTEEETLAFARIECHYFVNGGFMEEDGFLLSEKEMSKIRHIKTYIVQGRWDMVCPRKTAYDLARMFRGNAETVVVENAGHSTFEKGIEEELVKASELVGKQFGGMLNGYGNAG